MAEHGPHEFCPGPARPAQPTSMRLTSPAPQSLPLNPTTEPGEAGTGKRTSLRPLMAIKPYLLRHPWVLVLATIALVVSAIAMLTVPMAVRRMIDYGFGSGDGQMMDQYFAMLLVIGCILACASSLRFYLVNWIGERVVADLRSDVFQHLSRLGPQFFEATHSGEVMSRLTADTTQVKAAAGNAISQALRNIIMLIGALVMMFVTSANLSGLVLIAIPFIVLPLVAYGRVVRTLSRKAQDTLAEASAYAAENLAAVRTMQAFGHEDVVAGRYRSSVERSFDAAKERMVARAGLTGLVILLVVFSITGILWFGASSVVSGDISGGRLGQFVIYALFAAGALGELSEVWGEISQAAGAAERITEFLRVEPEVREPASPVTLSAPVRGDLEFRDVSFHYTSRPTVAALDQVSFRVAPGERVALVGPSGAGKSTILNLILRFYDPKSGEVTLDGHDIASLSTEALRQQIALVPQEVALFADTVFENIRYGSPHATLAEVQAAAKAAQAHEFIHSLPKGYDTSLGERGVTLSGGQRQRVAIARALLRNAPILLLDEATSALDAESELAVQRALDSLMKGRTSIVVAHRLATVQKADRILVIEKGRIVETGTHRELAQKSGLYARLSELQFGTEQAAE